MMESLPWPVRFLAGLTAGLVVGLIVFEALLAGSELLTPTTEIGPALAQGEGLPPGLIACLLAFWLLATTASASLATAITGWSIAGWLTGLCWLVTIILVAGLGGLTDLAIAAAIVAGITGTAIGIRLAQIAGSENGLPDQQPAAI
jgi:hypothetical protein